MAGGKVLRRLQRATIRTVVSAARASTSLPGSLIYRRRLRGATGSLRRWTSNPTAVRRGSAAPPTADRLRRSGGRHLGQPLERQRQRFAQRGETASSRTPRCHDQWRPNDKFLLNASIRYDNFTYDLPDSAKRRRRSSTRNMTANYTCVQASNEPGADAAASAGRCRRRHRRSTSSATVTRPRPRSIRPVRTPAGSIPTARRRTASRRRTSRRPRRPRTRSTTGSRASRRPTRSVAGHGHPAHRPAASRSRRSRRRFSISAPRATTARSGTTR